MKNVSVRYILVLIVFMLSGCLEASIIKELDSKASLKSASLEGIAASHQFQKTNSHRHIVHGSAGSGLSKVAIRSNTRGYQLYQGVQGQLISEESQ